MESIASQPGVLPVSGFWRRVVAFASDGLVLGVLGLAVGMLAFDALAQLGVYGRAVGFAVSLAYFGLLNSRVGGGQTLGKRALGIRATALDGQLLSVPRSLLRYSVLGLPWFLNGAPLPMDVILSPFGYVLSLIVFGGLLSILYLLVFNRSTRRSLHDYAAGSWVVLTDAPGTERSAPPLWRGHVIVVALLMLSGLLAPLLAQRLAQQMPMLAEMLPAVEAMNNEPGVKFANLNVGLSTNGEERHTYTAAMVQLAHPGVDDKALARRMARTVVRIAPSLGKRDVVAVDLRYGYDIGLAHGWRSRQFQFAPEQLQ
jgi:uncharacterized RDD family membrane protein YckC